MKTLNAALAATVLTVGPLMNTAWADDKAAVQKFYDFLSNPSSQQHADAFKDASSPTWISIGDYSGKNKSREKFLNQVGGFGQLMPDLNWAVEEMVQEGDKVAVRGRATGTPKGPFFGVDGQGRSFDILTIDIHKVENGKIVQTYHVEDWAGAIGQLKGK